MPQVDLGLNAIDDSALPDFGAPNYDYVTRDMDYVDLVELFFTAPRMKQLATWTNAHCEMKNEKPFFNLEGEIVELEKRDSLCKVFGSEFFFLKKELFSKK